MFLDDCPRSLSVIRAAIANRDGRGLKRAAHTLKGSVGVFQDRAATEAALAVEIVGRDEDWVRAPAVSAALTQEMARLATTLTESSLAGAGSADA